MVGTHLLKRREVHTGFCTWPIESFCRFVCSFLRVSVRILGEKELVLIKPQYERGVHSCGWKYGLIEVDLMPTLDGRVLHS